MAYSVRLPLIVTGAYFASVYYAAVGVGNVYCRLVPQFIKRVNK